MDRHKLSAGLSAYWQRALAWYGSYGLWLARLGLLLVLTLLWARTGGLRRSDVLGHYQFQTERDPELYGRMIAPLAPRPVILLSKQDAVVWELLANTRTMSEPQALRTGEALCDEAKALGYDPLLFLAVIHIESHYDHLAISPVGAEGLMQLMPGTALFMAERGKLAWPDNHSFNPVLNVRLGVRYLVELERMFGRMDYALTAYNRGPRNTRIILQNYGELPPHIADFYAGKVLQRYHMLRAAYGRLPLS